MNRSLRSRLALVAALAMGVSGALTVSVAVATNGEPPADQQMQLPPGWTMEDMMKISEAGTPGAMHQHLADSAGTWKTHIKMWMAPDTEPMISEGSSTVTTIMDGR